MWSQIFLTTSLREISGAPTKSFMALETGSGLRMPEVFSLPVPAFADEAAFGDEAAFAAISTRDAPKTLAIDRSLSLHSRLKSMQKKEAGSDLGFHS